MKTKADLHLHTNFSDGFYSPAKLIEKAKQNGITTISITDHDTLKSYDIAESYAMKEGIQIIPGVEISTDIEGKEVHLLAYFIDKNHPELKKYLSFSRSERLHRANRIVNKLQKMNKKITIEDVIKQGSKSSIGRPHVANALLKLELVGSYQEAFDKFLGDNGPAYEKKIHISPQSALKLIAESGGLSFIAHPGYMKESALMSLIEAGIDGIEVVHPSHKPHQVNFYRGIVNQYCLLESGGSDFHGGKKNDDQNLGKYYIPASRIETMRKMLQNK